MPRRVLLIALLLAFGMWLPLMVVPVVADIMEQQLSISYTLNALVFNAPVAMLALTAIPDGFLADKIGIKKAVGTGVVILALGSALRGLVMWVGYLGTRAGPIIGGIILDKTHGYQWIFIFLAIVSTVTTGIAFVIPETGVKSSTS